MREPLRLQPGRKQFSMGLIHRSFATGYRAGIALAAMVALVSPIAVRATALGIWTHAFAMYGEPKYPAEFAHYDFVNANAPKGGTLRLSNPTRPTSFDKFNPFTVRGEAPAAVSIFMFETLADASPDEPATMYGLIAHDMLVAPDYSSITFRIDPEAHFANGDPVTSADVKYDFDILAGPNVAPGVSQSFDGVKAAVVLDERTIRFDLKVPSRDQIYQLGTNLVVFSPKWGAGPDGKPKRFDQIVEEIPIATGPYTITRHQSGNFLELSRNRNYWAKDKGVRRGFFNFDTIIYHYYKDNAARLEAFKAGDFDLIKEYGARRWHTQYTGRKFDEGRIKKTAFPDATGLLFEGFLLNVRRPLFQDVRVREALNDSFDWEWNARQGYNLLSRFDGLFQNSEFAATGRPDAAELGLLDPYRQELPASVFGPLPSNPRTDTSVFALRENLKHARDLLAQAGWRISDDGRLRNNQGVAFEFDFLSDELHWSSVVDPWKRNLEKLGITLNYRTVDAAVYFKRLRTFDFDIILINYGGFLLPSANALQSLFASSYAEVEDSGNLMGIKNKAIDQALLAMSKADTLEQMRTATRVIDRIFVAEHYAIPYAYRPFHDVAYWNKFGIPAHYPKYYSIDDGQGAVPWPVMTWWDRSLHD